MKCPCCKGKGGYTDPILDFGIGPYYPCDYCHDETKVPLIKWIKWYYVFFIYDYLKLYRR